jgi:hypothetical protein
MAYAILRTYKHSTNGTLGAMGLHNQRSINTPNADPTRTPENKELVGSGDYLADVNARIEAVTKEQEAKGSKLLIQKNSVKAIEHLLTASPEYFNQPDKKRRIQDFVNASGEFLSTTYGRDNIVSVSLHLDEKTPHLTAIITPIFDSKVKGGKEVKRLGAKKWCDGRKKMRLMQDSFAEHCKPLGLERGKKNSKAKHTTIKDFYKIMNEAENQRKVEYSYPKIQKPGAMDLIQIGSWTENQNQKIKEEFDNNIDNIRQEIDLRVFKDAKERLLEKQYKEDVEYKKNAKNALNELKNTIVEKEGDNLKLQMILKETKSEELSTKELLRNVLEGRFSPDELKKIGRKFGARMIDKGKSIE